MSAIRFDEFPLAEFIIKGTEGEDLDLENINGETALTMACRNGKLRFVELLLQVSLSLSLRLSLSLGLGLRGYISLLLVTLFTWSAALDSSDVLLSYSIISLAQHITTILISTSSKYINTNIQIYLSTCRVVRTSTTNPSQEKQH